uniref:Beta-defensin-like domain-containing protein n=1 Tax=Chelydra serpentina TaxID=8475 RepID=A0A8C3T7L9_CHESE
ARVLGYLFARISLFLHVQYRNAHGSEASCRRIGGLCLMGKCIQAEHQVGYCFTPVIPCCKSLPVRT